MISEQRRAYAYIPQSEKGSTVSTTTKEQGELQLKKLSILA
jgi:hypothetical protein